jgi:hypothetical protein
MGTSVSALAAGRAFGQISAAPEKTPGGLPAPRIIYYNNFASHLLCAYNPNWGYPDGWGTAQLDAARGSLIDTEELWNWHSSVQQPLIC